LGKRIFTGLQPRRLGRLIARPRRFMDGRGGSQAARAPEALSSAESASSRAAGALTGLQRAERAVRAQVNEHERSRPGGLLGRLGIGQGIAGCGTATRSASTASTC
jgi:hypothetical protein